MKCHQARGFAAVLASGQDFKKAWGPPPQSEPEPVTCAACHNPHGEGGQLLRLPRAELCATCHGGKWQNLVLEGSGGYHYATAGWYTFSAHPHNGGDRCVTCHMASTAGAKGTGGHTFRMRVPAGGEPNTAGCAACHGQLDGYDTGGVQAAVRDLLGQLRLELELRNGGKLPGFQPGACNQCHRGGTLPFDHDPDLVLEKAYENYKLVDRDKSLGVHNPPYVLRLLQESINSVRQDYRQ
jgi:predicted CXXCH cytochrome family protein